MFKSLDDIKESIDSLKSDLKSKNLNPSEFCLVPFTTIILEPDGQVGVCRHKGHNFPIGNIKENSISEIWNGEFVRKWRREFLEGNARICNKELKHQQCHLCVENNKLLPYIELSEIQTQPIMKLTANFNGRCNLQCQMCDVWKQPNGLYDEINFWGPAKKDIFPHLKEIDMLAGEPFIQPDTFRLINEISDVNKDCQWVFTTNAHWKFTSKIENHLDKIKVKTFIVSLDSLNPDTYKKIRYPGKLEVALETLDEIIKYQSKKGPFNIVINFLIQQDNAYECLDMIDFCYEKKINPMLTFLYEPPPFSLTEVSELEKKKILDFYFEKADVRKMAHLKRILFPLIESLNGIDKAVYLLKMHEIMVRNS